jgi:hypothetical protein
MTGYETDHLTQNSEPGSSFGVVTEVSDVKTEEATSDRRRGLRFFSSPWHPYQLWGPSIPLDNGYQ